MSAPWRWPGRQQETEVGEGCEGWLHDRLGWIDQAARSDHSQSRSDGTTSGPPAVQRAKRAIVRDGKPRRSDAASTCTGPRGRGHRGPASGSGRASANGRAPWRGRNQPRGATPRGTRHTSSSLEGSIAGASRQGRASPAPPARSAAACSSVSRVVGCLGPDTHPRLRLLEVTPALKALEVVVRNSTTAFPRWPASRSAMTRRRSSTASMRRWLVGAMSKPRRVRTGPTPCRQRQDLHRPGRRH